MTLPQPKLVPTAEVEDLLWVRIRREADEVVRREPELAGFLHAAVLYHDALEAAVGYRIAQRLDHPAVPAGVVRHAFAEAVEADPAIAAAIRADILAVVDRDPATTRALDPVLYLKGFHALETHRLTHWLWRRGRTDLARYLQARSAEAFQVDIHPAAQIGSGVFFDHATGIVIGETAVVGDAVSLLQGVTLGGTGKEAGDRHPKIGRGVLIGAGAKVLGNIEVGPCARIGAGSVVLKPVPAGKTVAGVPARVVGEAGCAEPSLAMNQMFHDVGL
jgi:serine O-acetyltransferase